MISPRFNKGEGQKQDRLIWLRWVCKIESKFAEIYNKGFLDELVVLEIKVKREQFNSILSTFRHLVICIHVRSPILD